MFNLAIDFLLDVLEDDDLAIRDGQLYFIQVVLSLGSKNLQHFRILAFFLKLSEPLVALQLGVDQQWVHPAALGQHPVLS